MAATIDPESWIEFLRFEYLHSFVLEGGTSIKVAVPMRNELRGELTSGIVESAENAGFLVATVTADETRVHLIDQIFFRISQQIPWALLSERVILKLAREHGLLPPFEEAGKSLLVRLAEANNVDPDMLKLETWRWIGSGVFKHPLLAKEFRTAITQLCLAALSGGPDGVERTKGIVDWLTGQNLSISAVKPYQIFTRINKHNARYLLSSLLIWIRYAGYPGLVVPMDIARLSVPKNPRDGFLFYSKAQVLDAYEILRQFIDATDRMKSCLLVVLPGREFLDLEPYSRGMGAYGALKFRIFDEVHDERLVNPMGSLVRIDARRDFA